MPEEIQTNNPTSDSQPREESETGTGQELLEPLPESTSTEEATPTEPPKNQWWQDLGVPGVDTEQKAIEWASKSKEGFVRTSTENARLRELLAQLTKSETPTQPLTWEALLQKHTKDGKTDYDAALNERDARREEQFLQRIESQTHFKQAIGGTLGEIAEMAKSKIIPEWTPSEVDGKGNVTKAGSDFYMATDAILSELVQKVPGIEKDPSMPFFAMLAAEGLRSIREKKEVLKQKVGDTVRLAGGGNVVIPEKGNWAVASEAEIDKELSQLATKGG